MRKIFYMKIHIKAKQSQNYIGKVYFYSLYLKNILVKEIKKIKKKSKLFIYRPKTLFIY